MKRIIFILFAITMFVGNVNVCFAEDDFDKGLVLKGDKNDLEPGRQLDKLISGQIKDGEIKIEFDGSLGLTDIVIIKENNVIDNLQVNPSLRSDLTIKKSDLGRGSFRINFTANEDGSTAYTSFTIE